MCIRDRNITASDEDVDAQFDKMAEAYKMEKDQIKGMFGEEQIAQMKEDLALSLIHI